MPRSKKKPWQRPDAWYEVSIYPFGKRQRVLGRTADEAMRNAVRAFQRSFTPEQSDAAKASEPQEAQAGQRSPWPSSYDSGWSRSRRMSNRKPHKTTGKR